MSFRVKFKTKIRFFTGILIVFALTFCGCESSGDSTPETENVLTLKITMIVPAGGVGTRASGHITEYGNDEECAISEDDLYVLIFGNDGRQLFGSSSLELVKKDITSDDFITYILQTEPLDFDWKSEISSGIMVMVLANWKGFDPSVSYGNFGYSSIEDIYENGRDFNFTMPLDKGNNVWMPSVGDKKLIPMFGVSGELKPGDVEKNTENAAIISASISLMRSVAKVEIVDAMEASISTVVLTRHNKYGRFIPDIDKIEGGGAWNTSQLNAPSLPDIYSEPLIADNNEYFIKNLSLVKAPYTRLYTDERGETKKCPVFVAYLPEMYLSSDDTGLIRPSFNVATEDNANYEFSFDNYSGGSVKEQGKLESVIRNHIYRYIVTGGGVGDDLSAAIKLEVLPWDMQYDDNAVYYDDFAVAEDGWLKWKTIDTSVSSGTVSNGYVDFDYNYEEGQYDGEGELKLKMKSGSYSDNEYVEGTFTLTSPMYAKWRAILVQTDGKQIPSFSFVEVDDNGKITNIKDGELDVKSEISGTIDGNRITLRIANCSRSVTDGDNEARLVVTVEMPNGQQKEATIVRNPGIGRTNYIIFQEECTEVQ